MTRPQGIPEKWNGAAFVQSWTYREPEGEPLGLVVRYENNDDKVVIPFFQRNGSGWKSGAAPAPRPLYGLDQLTKHPDRPVLIVEGEKAADAAARLLGKEWTCMSWQGGSGAVSKADWSPLAGRMVFVWPDADEPGQKAALQVAEQCHRAGAASVSIIEPPADVLQGWDLADAEAAGWTAKEVNRHIAQNAFENEGADSLCNKKNNTIDNNTFFPAREGAEKSQVTTELPQKYTNDHKGHKYFTAGTRDKDIFTVANALVKNGCDENLTKQAIEILAKNCEPEFSAKQAHAKIDSAQKRFLRRERNIAAEIREWVETTNGHFLTTNCHKELQLTTREEIKAANMALLRLAEGENPLLEKHGNRRGCYRKIDRSVEFMDFLSADPENYLNLKLPLGLHRKTRFFPKSAIVLAGVSGMGKTLFALNVILQNMDEYPVFYFNAEMGPEALKHKLETFPISVERWAEKMKVVENWDFRNVADKIAPDALNIVDYLEPEGDRAFDIHSVISSIIQRLDKGVAFINVQKRPDAKMGAGGVYSIKAASMALALDWCRLEVVKNRFREFDPEPAKNKIKFKVTAGYKFSADGNWYE